MLYAYLLVCMFTCVLVYFGSCYMAHRLTRHAG